MSVYYFRYTLEPEQVGVNKMSEELEFLMIEKKRVNDKYQMYRDGVKAAMVGTITDVDTFCDSDITLECGTEKLYRAMELAVFYKKKVEELDTKIKEITNG